MRLKCSRCHKEVSSEISEGTVVRAWVECPECIEKGPDGEITLGSKHRFNGSLFMVQRINKVLPQGKTRHLEVALEWVPTEGDSDDPFEEKEADG